MKIIKKMRIFKLQEGHEI